MSKRKKSRFGLLILLIIGLYFAYEMVGQQKLLYSKSLEMQKMQSKVNEETKVNEDLEKEQKTMNSDEYIEKVAREKLGMVKKGERVFVDTGR
jgi:cell division protein FtsL